MMLKLKQVALAGAMIVLALPALAKDVALVIGNSDYRNQPRTPDAGRVDGARDALAAAGFQVIYGENLTKGEQFIIAGKFYAAVRDAERVVVVVSGQIASSARDSWLLGVDADQPNVFTIGGEALSLGALMDVLSQKPGAALMFIAENHNNIYLSDWMTPNAENLTAGQGVTLVRGPTREVLQFLEQSVLVSGQSMGKAREQVPDHTVMTGFISNTMPFLPEMAPMGVDIIRDDDFAYWKAVQAIGTVEAIQSYVDRYPNGNYIRSARDAIEDLQAQPEVQARAGEERLKLKRAQRRQIQRNLSILGFNPRGIDGLFGRGSRAAIGAWQQSRGIDGYGYLTGNQISALQSVADIRSQELEEEARLRQEEQDRQDATYWRQTGRDGTEASLRAYLKRYPDGLYSEIAQTRVDEFDEERRVQAAAVEREYWDDVQSVGSAAAYRQYLQQYPRGAFARVAKEQLAQLEGPSRDEELIRRARADEARVAGNGIARLLVEQKLQALGLKPGRVDGKFDDKTRRAVRKFQRARQIPVTGYVTQQTIVRLLAAR